MTFGELQADCRRKLREASATFWTDADVKDAINEAIHEFADATEYCERQANIQTLTGRTYYDLTSVLPDTFLSPRRAYNPTTSRWSRPSGTRELDYQTYVRWELVYGPPEHYFLRGHGWLGVFPRPSNDDGFLRLYYTAIPEPMTADEDTPGFPRECHPGIVDLALSDLLAQERETEKAVMYWNRGQAYINRLMDHVNSRQRIPEKRSV